MLTFISRSIGVIVVLVLALIGAREVAEKILSWKDGHDNLYLDRKNTPTVI